LAPQAMICFIDQYIKLQIIKLVVKIRANSAKYLHVMKVDRLKSGRRASSTRSIASLQAFIVAYKFNIYVRLHVPN